MVGCWQKVLIAGVSAGVLGLSTAVKAEPAPLPVVPSAALAVGMQVPWSRPVLVKDPFEGESLGVFDRHEFSRGEIPRVTVLSLWQPQRVRFLVGYGTQCSRPYVGYLFVYFPVGGLSCSQIDTSRRIDRVQMKIGEQPVTLTQGENNTFAIPKEVARVLGQAPESNVLIRLVTTSGELIDSEIGVSTVRAWQQIYSAVSP